SSTTLKGRHKKRAKSRPSMPPRTYSVRMVRSFRKARVRPASLRLSGAVGASGAPALSQSTWPFFCVATMGRSSLLPPAAWRVTPLGRPRDQLNHRLFFPENEDPDQDEQKRDLD